MSNQILHILSQRPSLTGSGITLDAFVRLGRKAGWDQHVICGVPSSDSEPMVGGLPQENIHPFFFEQGRCDFPVPGMSDVMPYLSTRFSTLSNQQIDRYLSSWRDHIGRVLEKCQPNLIHSHHLWLLSAIIKDIAPEIPVVTQCHATGFRQMVLCPQLKERVVAGLNRNDHFLVLHDAHLEEIVPTLGLAQEKVTVVGAGYREELFQAAPNGRVQGAPQIVYIGKYSHAKGLPWLLDSIERISKRYPGMVLHVAGTGEGEEADGLRRRMEKMEPLVKRYGQLPQEELARLMGQCSICVLPSFYEGLPLVLVEALACGCRLVATALPGAVGHLAPHLGEALELVPLPRLRNADIPFESDLPLFVDHLTRAIENTISKQPIDTDSAEFSRMLAPFTWNAVFTKVEAVWKNLI